MSRIGTVTSRGTYERQKDALPQAPAHRRDFGGRCGFGSWKPGGQGRTGSDTNPHPGETLGRVGDNVTVAQNWECAVQSRPS